jgi:hypothetical protein
VRLVGRSWDRLLACLFLVGGARFEGLEVAKASNPFPTMFLTKDTIFGWSFGPG